MKRKLLKVITLIAMLAVMLFPLASCGDTKVNVYTLPDVSVGETFEITLTGSGTYFWEYMGGNVTGIELVSSEALDAEDADDRVGVHYPIRYTFKATKSGRYKFKFKCQIPWEPKTPPLETNIYRITVVK